MTVNLKFVQTPAIALYSPLSAAGTSMVIVPYPVDLDGNKLTIGDFGSNPTVTIDPKVSGFEEIISFSGITDNGNNTALLTGLTRNLASKYPYTATGTGKQHGSSAVVVFSDNPQVFGRLAGKDNDETITGQWTFLSFPITPATPNASTTVIGMSKLSVAPTSSVNPIAVGDNDPRILQNAYNTDSGTANTYVLTTAVSPGGYSSGQIYIFKATNANTGPSTLNVDTLGAKSIRTAAGAALTAGMIIAGQIVLVEYDGTNFQMLSNPANAAIPFFGGTGADGALAVASGTTNIDCAGARFLVKNYTSISITGTGAIKFINPHANGTTIVIKSQGNVTLTSSTAPMIDTSGMGAAGGAAVSSGASSASTVSGNNGNTGQGFGPFVTNPGLGSTSGSAGTDGAVPTAISIQSFIFSSILSVYKYGLSLWIGAGGGSGSAYNNTGSPLVLTSGIGGFGGGCLIIECGGALNFTTANGISVAGLVGGNGTGTGTTNGKAGGGGGGSGGFALVIYNTLVAASGTINISGGAVGNNTAGTGNAAPGGAAANAVTAGATGAGPSGVSLVVKNTEYY